MKIPVTIMVDIEEDSTPEETAALFGSAMYEIVRNEHRAWALYELGESSGRSYCDIPDEYSGHLACRYLKRIMNALSEMGEAAE